VGVAGSEEGREPLARYGEALRQAIRATGQTQRQFATKVPMSESSLSETLAGRRLPSDAMAARIASRLPAATAAEVTERYELAAAARRPSASPETSAPPETVALPAEIVGLVRRLRQVTDSLPYQLNSSYQVSLSSVYVRQSVAAPTEVGQLVTEEILRREDDKGEVRLESIRAAEQRRITGRVRPFEDVLGEHDHLVIEGAAGLGKTTLGHNLVHDLAEALLNPGASSPLSEPHIPLMIPARVLAAHMRAGRSQTLAAAVASEYEMLSNGEVPASFFDRPVCGMRWLVAVDALDEIPEGAARERLLTALVTWMSSTDEPLRLVVTTRPLSPGETARLPKAGFYELQGFDREAMSSFARRWFDPDGTPAGALRAAEFLDQVRAAGLEEIVKVPLLATVAAYVLQSRPGRPLPASRYELYEEYIDQYSVARTRARTAVLASLSTLPEGRQLGDWLETHRRSLLEELAVAYTTSEVPLLEVLQRALGNRASVLDRLPGLWQQTIADWLTQTGLLSRSRPRLRFLHQTFAEHLAATARARKLPSTFDPALPEWQDAVSGRLLGSEADEQILLHYLHLSGPSADVLTWLQAGSQAARDAAGGLINQGAPVSEAQLEVYLVRVADKVSTGAWSGIELRELSGLTRHASVCAHLYALLCRADVGAAAKIGIVDLLRERSIKARREGVPLLRTFMEPTHSPQIRRGAAEVLAKLPGEDRTAAAKTLYLLATDPGCGHVERVRAAEALAKLGGSDRSRAAKALDTLVTEPAVISWRRTRTAQTLAEVDDEHRSRAATLLYELATDASEEARVRRGAAEGLMELGGEHRPRAGEVLLGLAADPTTPIAEQAFALAAAAALDPAHDLRLAGLLRGVATDPATDAQEQRDAARKLAELGGEHRETAAAALHQMAADLTRYAVWRREAATELAKFGGAHRGRAAAILEEIALDPTMAAYDRLSTARELARLGGEYRSAAAVALYELATDPMIAVPERREAAQEVAKVGEEYRQRVLAFFDAVLRDTSSAPSERVLATVVTAALRPDTRSLIAMVATDLHGVPAANDQLRIEAATALLESGPDTIADAVDLLRGVAANIMAESEHRREAAETLAKLGDEVHRTWAADILCELAADPVADARERQAAAAALTELGSTYRERVVDILCEIAADPTIDASSRLWCADMLGYVGDIERGRLALHWLISYPVTHPSERIWPARWLAKFGGEGRRRAAEALEAMSLDALIDPGNRRQAAHTLATLGGQFWKRGVDLLYALAADPTSGVADRALALAELAMLDREHRPDAACALALVIADHTVDPSEREESARQLATLDARQRDTAATALRDMATGPGVDVWTRRQAAEHLAELGGEHFAAAAAVLHDIATDPVSDSWERLYAAQQLAKWGGKQRGRAAAALRQIAADPIADPDDRRSAAQDLAKLGKQHRAEAAEALYLLAIDSTIAVGERQQAAQELARLGIEHARRILAFCGVALADPYSSPTERIFAAVIFAALRPDANALAIAVLDHLATAVIDQPGEEPFVAPELRRRAAVALIEAGPDSRPRGIELLAAAAADPVADADDRHEAALALARLGGTHRARAAELLRELATDVAVDSRDRRWAASKLATFGATQRAQACTAFYNLATDPTNRPENRLQAAAKLLTFGDEHDQRAQAADVLRQLATYRTVEAHVRRSAAEQLASLGEEYRAEAADALPTSSPMRWSTRTSASRAPGRSPNSAVRTGLERSSCSTRWRMTWSPTPATGHWPWPRWPHSTQRTVPEPPKRSSKRLPPPLSMRTGAGRPRGNWPRSARCSVVRLPCTTLPAIPASMPNAGTRPPEP
jgi:transcriptional regulator with XRE-family HTH domain